VSACRGYKFEVVSNYMRLNRGNLTLINPPSGFALRKAGCAFIFGCSSDIDLIFVNSGTDPLPGGPCVDCGCGRRGDIGSLPNSIFNCTVADVG
jgi:hypothetical protein